MDRKWITMERKWIFPLAIGSIVSLFLLFLTTLTSPDGVSLFPIWQYYSPSASVFVESKLNSLPINDLFPLPRLAYLISSSARDGAMLRRMLQALYHPNNQYVVHLDAESSAAERLDLYN